MLQNRLAMAGEFASAAFGWLSDALTPAVDSSTSLYKLRGVMRQRESWLARNRAYFEHRLPHDIAQNMNIAFGSSGDDTQTTYHLRFPEPTHNYSGKRMALDFIYAVHEAPNLLPPAVHALFIEKGEKLIFGQTIEDTSPSPSEQDFSSSLGVYEPRTGRSLIPMAYMSRKHGGYVMQGGDETRMSALHEFGHALDIIVLQFGERCYKDFKKAWQEDAKVLVAVGDDKKFPHYLSIAYGGLQEDDEIAMREVFAEMFAETISGLSSDLRTHFPQSAVVLDRILLSLEHLIANTPDFSEIVVQRKAAPA